MLEFTVSVADWFALNSGELHYMDSFNCPMARAVKAGLSDGLVLTYIGSTHALINDRYYCLDERGLNLSQALLRSDTIPENRTFSLIGLPV